MDESKPFYQGAKGGLGGGRNMSNHFQLQDRGRPKFFGPGNGEKGKVNKKWRKSLLFCVEKAVATVNERQGTGAKVGVGKTAKVKSENTVGARKRSRYKKTVSL